MTKIPVWIVTDYFKHRFPISPSCAFSSYLHFSKVTLCRYFRHSSDKSTHLNRYWSFQAYIGSVYRLIAHSVVIFISARWLYVWIFGTLVTKVSIWIVTDYFKHKFHISPNCAFSSYLHFSKVTLCRYFQILSDKNTCLNRYWLFQA